MKRELFAKSNVVEYISPFVALDIDKISIPNRSIAHGLECDKDTTIKTVINEELRAYNSYIDNLCFINDFKEFFLSHESSVSHSQVIDKWGEEVWNAIAKIPHVHFDIPLVIKDNVLFDKRSNIHYTVNVESNRVDFQLDSLVNSMLSEGKEKLLWNWYDAPDDVFTVGVWEVLLDNGLIPYDEEGNDLFGDYGYGYQFEDHSNPNLLKCVKLLEDAQYIRRYTVTSESHDIRWSYYFRYDGTVELGILDLSFLKNKLIMERIKLLLGPYEDSVLKYGQKVFFLTDEHNRQYISEQPGTMGGNISLKIYGRLDCPSANRYIDKGYARRRVFFKDEQSAIAAGYRPCGVCMKESYSQWKMINIR